MGRHRWKAAAVAVVTALALSGAVWAAPPGSPGATAKASHDTGAPTYDCAGPYSTVSEAVYCAHQVGETGTVLANSVHEVLAYETNAPGIAVAEAVYQRLSSGTTGSGGGVTPFSDLSEAPWATAAVDALQQANVVNGTGNGQFSPNQPVTVAELATMLARLQAGTAGSNGNVPSGTPSWARNGMAWASAGAIFQGIEGLGAPDSPLTRAQAVLMLLNTVDLGPTAATQSNATIALSGTVPTWAHGALALAIQLGLLKGSNGQLLANQPLTRAQMSVLLARLATLESEAVNSGS